MKILIIRFSSIGDIVLTTPVIRCLKIQAAQVTVHYATKKQYQVILENNPYIDRVFYLENKLNDLIVQLKNEQYDWVIDLHNNLRTRIIKWKLGVQSYSFNKLNLEKWLMVNLKINRLPDVHIVDRYLKTIQPLGIKNDGLGLDYFIPEKDEVPLSWFPLTHRQGFIAYAIGAQHETKKLPVKRMIELCKNINRPMVLLGGKEDYENGETVSLAVGEMIFNTCGKLNLNQSASLVKQAQYVFTHDTGLMHIAAAFKKEVYVLWGNTIPAFGMYPYRTKFTSLENIHLRCRPCSKIGYNKCPKGHFKCMNEIDLKITLP
ncbi:MAG: glycosyltransferase family 9 protein [Bacteroidetes bacterium]|nr:glycosyltransferase family 9 protein [Bacteroidota bacterium]MBS1980989.1 glycosyltransferase family 9 protein [Bacteroidota bacterium]